jgi:hypothetical protein
VPGDLGMRIGFAICIVKKLALVAGNLDEPVSDLFE